MFPFHKIQAGTMCSVWGLASYKGVEIVQILHLLWLLQDAGALQARGQALLSLCSDRTRGEPGLGGNSQGPSCSPPAHTVINRKAAS